MPKPERKDDVRYTYRDYVAWDGPERWELIQGVPYMLASPSPLHQQIVLQLGAEFALYLRGKSCQAYVAPMDLCFDEDEGTMDVVQPDLFIMCPPFQADRRVVGIPVLVVEVLSPSTAAHDTIRKMLLYERAGVPEYWIVEPEERVVHVYRANGGTLRWNTSNRVGDRISPVAFPDLSVDVGILFDT
ncbi:MULTISPECIES: Uma2 family endonuclease [Alicyclobacillus]|uniref:Endonuclease, Uma2 family (Restriction endonuclease fold) n=1 Tax=Alicyclobacillus vulcanalis TaxID=252246 RepID=A0A1N7N6J8_9BACL|nr:MULTISPECIES: Uma2 family endonuclease [Alicyclobacillus]SIS93964.1 Endonuclease, Uma2 family (restriction endonuclease fold) [Alicyclobacillus vulcanalis]